MNNKLTRYRDWTAHRGVQTFSAPYLPDRLVYAALILIFLNAVLVLLNQNLQY